jgi:phage host-nuclease inhibitor protein Gam
MDALSLIRTAETMEPAPARDAVPAELADYADDHDPEVRGAWSIETLGSADWALSRLAECEAESREILAQAAEAKRRIDERANHVRLKAERGIAFFKFKLLGFAETHRALMLGTGSKKSRDFIHGRIGWRTKAERLVVKDEAALLEWLAAQPIESGLYRLKIEPEMKALQHLFKQGEVPPGMEVEPSQESITITAEAPEVALAKG